MTNGVPPLTGLLFFRRIPSPGLSPRACTAGRASRWGWGRVSADGARRSETAGSFGGGFGVQFAAEIWGGGDDCTADECTVGRDFGFAGCGRGGGVGARVEDDRQSEGWE